MRNWLAGFNLRHTSCVKSKQFGGIYENSFVMDIFCWIIQLLRKDVVYEKS